MNTRRFIIILTSSLLLTATPLFSGGKISVHGIYMVPYGTDAKEVSRPGWGLGGDLQVGLPGAHDVLLGVVGIEYINLLVTSDDLVSFAGGVPIPYTKETDQWYGRLRAGLQIGGLGNGFFRPYLGLNGALVLYRINTDLIFHPGGGEEDFTEHAYDDMNVVFGCDLTLGMDLKVWDQISIDGGIKYLKSFGVPDQLGGESVRIYPQYFQICLGITLFSTGNE